MWPHTQCLVSVSAAPVLWTITDVRKECGESHRAQDGYPNVNQAILSRCSGLDRHIADKGSWHALLCTQTSPACHPNCTSYRTHPAMQKESRYELWRLPQRATPSSTVAAHLNTTVDRDNIDMQALHSTHTQGERGAKRCNRTSRLPAALTTVLPLTGCSKSP